jgi:acid phosphatase (class A)
MTIMKKTVLTAVALSVLVIGTGHAQILTKPTPLVAPATGTPAPAPRPTPKFIYLSPTFLANPGLIVPPPPSAGSPEAMRDLAAVMSMQAAATPERIALAASDDKIETVWRYSDVLPGFEASKLPLTDKLFTAARNDQNIVGNVFKPFFARPRPYEIDPNIGTCVPSNTGKPPRSYPSGHALMGYSLGIILAQLIPEKASVILERARIYGESRVICGVHFPSDIVASQAVGTAVALQLMGNPSFKAEFDAAKAELVAAGLTR